MQRIVIYFKNPSMVAMCFFYCLFCLFVCYFFTKTLRNISIALFKYFKIWCSVPHCLKENTNALSKKKILQNTFIFIYQMLLLLQSHLSLTMVTFGQMYTKIQDTASLGNIWPQTIILNRSKHNKSKHLVNNWRNLYFNRRPMI